MRRFSTLGAWPFLVLLTAAATFSPAAELPSAKPLPSAEDVLAAHRQNLEQLASLHLQMNFVHEYTRAFRDEHHSEAEKTAEIIKLIESGELTLESFGSELKAL